MRKWIQRGVILAFCFLITLPLIFVDRSKGAISQNENRVLADFPVWSECADFSAFRDGVENWISDKAGGRTQASQILTQVSWDLWNVSERSDTLIGKDKWLFYVTDNVLRDYRHEHWLDENGLALYTQLMNMLTEKVAQVGADTYFMTIPDKKTTYSEYFSENINVLEQPSQMEMLTTYYEENGLAPILNLTDALMAEKGRGQLYFARSDTAHWNFLGAMVGYETLMDTLAPQYPALHRLNWEDVTVTPVTTEALFNDAVKIQEPGYAITVNQPGALVDDSAWLDQFAGLCYADVPAVYKIRTINQSQPDAPKILWVGDSYSGFIRQYVQESCSEFTLLHMSDMTQLDEVMAAAQPDVVIFESVERMIDSFLVYVAQNVTEQ